MILKIVVKYDGYSEKEVKEIINKAKDINIQNIQGKRRYWRFSKGSRERAREIISVLKNMELLHIESAFR